MSWPALNALLNGASGVLLLAGYASIRTGHPKIHRVFMTAAVAVSIAFLISYLSLHAQAGATRFQKEGWIRGVYFLILLSHSVLAAAVVPLAGLTLAHAMRGNFPRHRAIARRTLPVWLYVSLTGVTVYWMLYRI
jgi:uncharacterized membrane protein YozB (DUF420 family)